MTTATSPAGGSGSTAALKPMKILNITEKEAFAVRSLLWEVFVHRTLGVRRRLGLSGGLRG
jgi:hypothetical protein